MKVHYFNILLFALPLNILVHNQRNHKSILQHIRTTRLLCECDIYIPNYDSDPQMKEVMEIFNKQTQQRFHEYDERMKTTHQKCKEQCDKEIQKIILKDKLEKELMDKFATLQTDIQSDAIPTCFCEKSIEDKMEKGCLRCAQNLGGIVAPSSGVLGEIAALALSGWKTAAIDAATKYAMAQGAAEGAIAGNAHGMEIVIHYLEQ
ncbi:rifin, partial [Plasmodium reichenowi]